MSWSGSQTDHSSLSPPESSSTSDDEDSPSPSPPPNPGPYEWLRLTDIIFAVFNDEVSLTVSWSPANLMVYSFPNLDAAPPTAIWYLSLESRTSNSSGQSWYTIDLYSRPWSVVAEESSLTFMFDLGTAETGNWQRYLIKTGRHESFSYLLNHVAYIRGCAAGATLPLPEVP